MPGAATDGAAVVPLTVAEYALSPAEFPAATCTSYSVLDASPVSVTLATLVPGAAVHDPAPVTRYWTW